MYQLFSVIVVLLFIFFWFSETAKGMEEEEKKKYKDDEKYCTQCDTLIEGKKTKYKHCYNCGAELIK